MTESVARADVFRLLAKITRVPDEARTFDVPSDEVRERYRIPLDVLDFMAAHGLSRGIGPDGEVAYDERDMTSVALHLGYSPVARVARRFWATGLNLEPRAGRLHYRLEYQGTCPDPGHGSVCRYRLARPGLGVVEQLVDAAGRVLARDTVSPETDWPPFSDAARALLSEAADLDLLFVPRSLRYDLDFIRKARVCDCAGATALLLDAAARYGVQARWAFGLIAVPPFAATHNWIEILTDGRWVPADPVLIKAMIEWGALDPTQWSPYRSPGAIFLRLADQDGPVAVHEDVPVPVSMAIRVVDDPAATPVTQS
ncbi:transglutaminase domain-containing protein [Streptomyces sp. S.PNR 29]|uniref:transglutaminase domain-containing protein n=1 Tax=Streptomyces sp. S.PNR 29 TaxID=2973805 RepID=UPI0025B0F71E|nr:transglutaminase domain-containing protein [Streptomyces sp. S.PNR 29]MDN0201109.1 hypothetical protein [Streptomyces sp. S.PNR 29]